MSAYEKRRACNIRSNELINKKRIDKQSNTTRSVNSVINDLHTGGIDAKGVEMSDMKSWLN